MCARAEQTTPTALTKCSALTLSAGGTHVTLNILALRPQSRFDGRHCSLCCAGFFDNQPCHGQVDAAAGFSRGPTTGTVSAQVFSRKSVPLLKHHCAEQVYKTHRPGTSAASPDCFQLHTRVCQESQE